MLLKGIQPIQPGHTIIEEKEFQLNADYFSVDYEKQHQTRTKKDYEILFLTTEPEIVFKNRLTDYQKKYEIKEPKKVKNK